MAELCIEWDYGRPADGGAEDEARALAAARKVFQRAGVSEITAWREYRALIADENECAVMTVWGRAEAAANAALTRGWAEPSGAWCSLVMREIGGDYAE